MASSSGSALVKREFIKSEYVKSEFDRKIDLSAIPRAPTAAPVSVKNREKKDAKVDVSLLATAGASPRGMRRRFLGGTSINYQTGTMRIKAHYDRHKQAVRFTIMNGYAPAAGDNVYDTAQDSIFKQLRARANFSIQPKNPDYFPSQVAAAMATTTNKNRVEVEVAVEPHGTFRASVAVPYYSAARSSTYAAKTESLVLKTTPVATMSQATSHSTAPAPNSMFAITEKTRETVKQTTDAMKSTLAQPFKVYAQKESPFADVKLDVAAPRSGLPGPPSLSASKIDPGVKREPTPPEEKPEVLLSFESPLQMPGAGFEGS